MHTQTHEQRFSEIDSVVSGLIDAVLESGVGVLYGMGDELKRVNIGKGEFCMNCDPCHNLMFSLPLLNDLITGKMTVDQAKENRLAWKYAIYADQAMKHLVDTSELRFNRVPTTTSCAIVYLDQNVFSVFTKDDEVKKTLRRLKSGGILQFVYSPSHLEEINKILEESYRQAFIEAISELTDDKCLQPSSNDQIDLFIENPADVLARAAVSPEATDAVERIKTLKEESRELHFPEYNDESHRIALGQRTDVFDALTDEKFSHLMSHSASSRFQKDQFKNLLSHSDIRNAIYALHNGLDLLSFKRETSERTRRSSVHDIEHLIYGSQSQVFVSNDAKLVARARQIYPFLGIGVKVLSLDQFLESGMDR
ncbi:hypothetical protein [Burkholderia sp. Ac-20365]|uniref:hypothetical protein n=1 Tax=Burkholderia sp. Ac-20365 TaxID=2703897 RepID=UPI00197B57AC|nr:hypothetical protein [Burkholderia sp. Ac-20365]MBN3762025.1 hypothetical protein [Burkholderia sp. Ac-20365]